MTEVQAHIKIAYDYGIIKDGLTFEDYLIEAVDNDGYETISIWGVQGSGKSSRMLQMGFWIFKHLLGDERLAWEAVLDHVIFKPADFITRLEAVPRGERIPVILWDDLQAHYTSSTFKTDIAQYQAIDATWAVIRTKLAVVITTIPLIDRMAKNIKDNVTFEVYIGRNQKEMIKRVYHLPGIKRMETNLFKVIVERPAIFDLYEVPKWVWDRYWDMRLELTDEAISGLKNVTDMGDVDNYYHVREAARLLRKSTNTVQQMASRGVIEGRKIKGVLHILKEDVEAELGLKEHLDRQRKNISPS